jgi:hypothetical protein
VATCEVCGNDYELTFEVHAQGAVHVFDSFECAIYRMAPICEHCQCRIIGRGVEAGGHFSVAPTAPVPPNREWPSHCGTTSDAARRPARRRPDLAYGTYRLGDLRAQTDVVLVRSYWVAEPSREPVRTYGSRRPPWWNRVDHSRHRSRTSEKPARTLHYPGRGARAPGRSGQYS